MRKSLAGSLILLLSTYLLSGCKPESASPEKTTAIQQETEITQEVREAHETLKLAETSKQTGNCKDAVGFYEQALQVMREKDQTNPDIYNTLDGLAQCYVQLGNYSKAGDAYLALQKIVNAHKQDTAEIQKWRLQVASGLGAIYSLTGRYKEAETEFQKVLEYYENYPNDSANLAAAYANLGNNDFRAKAYPKAESHLEQALALYDRVSLAKINSKYLELTKANITATLSTWGLVYARQSRFEDAEAAIRRAMKINKETFMAGHPNEARELNNLAFVYQSKGDFDSALELYGRSLAIYRNLLPANHPNILKIHEHIKESENHQKPPR